MNTRFPPRRTVFETPVIRSVLRGIAMVLLRMFGWRTRVVLPDVPKLVLVIAPHTSYWDFPILLAAAPKHLVSASWLGKHTLFRGPGRWLFRWLGVSPSIRRTGVMAEWHRCWRLFGPGTGCSWGSPPRPR